MKKSVLLWTIFFLMSFHVALAGKSGGGGTDSVQISSVNDINLGNWMQASMSGNSTACIYHSAATTYHVTGTDSSTITPNGFYMQDASATHQIPFSLYWGNTPSPGTTPMGDGVQLAATGADTQKTNCGGGSDADFAVNVNNSALAAVPSGTYTDTITLLVQP